MFSSSDSNSQRRVGKHHSESELASRSKQYGDNDLGYGSSSHQKHQDTPSFDSPELSAPTRGSDNKYYGTSGASAYTERDNDPNRNSFNSKQTHSGNSGSSGSYDIGNLDPSSYGNRYTSPGVYDSGDRDTNPSSYAGSNRDSSPFGTAKSTPSTGVTSGPSIFPQGAYSAPEEYDLDVKPGEQQGTDVGININRESKSGEYASDTNKRHENQSFASRMMGKVKHVMGVDDDSKEHHQGNDRRARD
ncbi:hypothetical protein Gpo141_00005866 [Globisporangium polare]